MNPPMTSSLATFSSSSNSLDCIARQVLFNSYGDTTFVELDVSMTGKYTIAEYEQANFSNIVCGAQGLHSHILMMMRGGGGLSDFFGSEILAKSDFLWSMKDAGIFLGHEKKKQRNFLGCKKRNKEFFWVC